MCFSATASFVTVAVTGSAGLFAIARTVGRREIPLAATPLLFAIQQAIEGLLWLELANDPLGPGAMSLTFLFLLLAKAFWPIYVPITVYLAEPVPSKRRALGPFIAAGLIVAAFFAWSVSSHSLTAMIGDGHIIYGGEPEAPVIIQLAYFIVTGTTALLSSHRTLRAFSLVVLAGSLVSYIFYWEAFSSVWCFFAAAASAILIFHFEQVRYMRRIERGAPA